MELGIWLNFMVIHPGSNEGTTFLCAYVKTFSCKAINSMLLKILPTTAISWINDVNKAMMMGT